MKSNKILIVGPIFNSLTGPTGQGGQLYSRLEAAGFSVLRVSHHRNKVFRMLHTLFAVLQFWRYDIILLQSFGLLAFILEDLVSLIATLVNKPIVFTLRGGAFIEFYHRHQEWVQHVLDRAATINAPSLYLQENLIKSGFNVQYIPNFIELDSFPFSRKVARKHSLLWVRAFHEIYHPELAIETLYLLKKKYPDVNLTMVGPDMGLLPACKELIEKYNLAANIKITGPIPNSELHQYYQTHQVFLTTTRYESFGVAIIEAGSCGIPCVSVSVGEIPYIWKDRENIILAERTPEDFALKISELFENTELRDKVSVNARKNAEQFTWENVQPLWMDTIERLVVNTNKKK